ncbi:ATP synthase subunit s, mitochondrial-like [Coccinella septempunctata]|uniref:ATP synthase subunit s, mitochondrial-like n=1 Tax=Coccinella septempunctata TaxID=41139 RepID=UPI001D08D4F7|nr:ATP synthase subunit s, mitochondrial-like [Coccinella septempunctata]
MLVNFISKHPLRRFTSRRNLFHFITLSFNQVDEERRKMLGPDRVCAEWILKNGGSVRWLGDTEYITDYNLLPPERTKKYIEGMDATNSSISHHGFPHLKGCLNIREVILRNCSYIEDEAIAALEHLKGSLTHLIIEDCPNVTLKGLSHVLKQKRLKRLILRDFLYINKNELEHFIQETSLIIPSCRIN